MFEHWHEVYVWTLARSVGFEWHEVYVWIGTKCRFQLALSKGLNWHEAKVSRYGLCKCQLWLEITQLPSQNTSFCTFCIGISALCKFQLWLKFAQVRYSIVNHVSLSVLRWEIRLVYVSILTWNYTIAVFYCKTHPFVCFAMEYQLCVTFNSDFNWHKCDTQLQNAFFWVFPTRNSDLCNWQLWLEITQIRYSIDKTRLFVRFPMEYHLCVSFNSDFNLHKYDVPLQNTFTWVLCSEKSDLCYSQLSLEITYMCCSTAKNIFLCVLH